MSQILTQPVGLYSYLDTKLSILENRPNVGAGLVPAQTTRVAPTESEIAPSASD